MLDDILLEMAKSVAGMRGRTDKYTIQKDGSISYGFVDPEDTENVACDKDTHVGQQVFIEGYANAVEIDVEDAEEGEIDLIPSQRYQTIMKQNIIQQAMSVGKMDMEKVKYLTMANLAVMIIFGLIGFSML